MNSFTPWVEKYRPVTFDTIVLDPLNKKIIRKYYYNQTFS